MKKLSKNTKPFVPVIVVIVLIIAGLGVYLHSSMWLFTPEFTQRQNTESFLNDVYKNKMTTAYNQTDSDFQSKNSLSQFTSAEVLLVGSHYQTHLLKYYQGTKVSIISGSIYNLSSGVSYVINLTFSGNKIDSFSAVQT